MRIFCFTFFLFAVVSGLPGVPLAAPIRSASGAANGTPMQIRAGEICGDPFTRAGLNNGISPKLLYAIARRESGLRPFALNVDGQAVFPPSRDHALTSAIRAKSNVDVGLMQVSYTIWKSRYGLSIADLLNPYRNVETGARILRRLLDFHPLDFLKAVGKYHTGNAEIGRDYSMGVLREWVKAGFDLQICWEEA
ncbi:MAG: lytic transglycosylase domain-containing protein [Nitrospirae bacterium]|nr:lytic transglycosylase domain-containing protein [Nitrospirota bacterium]